PGNGGTFGAVAASYTQDGSTVSAPATASGIWGSYVTLVSASTNVTWDGGPSAAGTDWLTAANWSNDTAPGASSIATFGSIGTATNIGIDIMGATNNGAANHAVGQIKLAADANRNITVANSASQNGTLTVNGA